MSEECFRIFKHPRKNRIFSLTSSVYLFLHEFAMIWILFLWKVVHNQPQKSITNCLLIHLLVKSHTYDCFNVFMSHRMIVHSWFFRVTKACVSTFLTLCPSTLSSIWCEEVQALHAALRVGDNLGSNNYTSFSISFSQCLTFSFILKNKTNYFHS